MKYIIINEQPVLSEAISIPRESLYSMSVMELFSDLNIKGTQLIPLSRDKALRDDHYLDSLGSKVKELYLKAAPYLREFFETNTTPYTYVPLGLDNVDVKRQMLINYLANHGINLDDLTNPSLFRFKYYISDELVYSRWYSDRTTAYNQLIELVQSINGDGKFILDI